MKKNNLFYINENTADELKYYKKMLGIMGSLSNLFSTNSSPYLSSRVVENLFCRCLEADNLSRSDITADAKKNNVGIGIKTWIDSNIQKIAEFNRYNADYAKLNVEKKIEKIVDLRNDRIDFTMRTQNLEKMIYHCIKREEGKILIYETPLMFINKSKIKITDSDEKVIKFKDDINKYSFNLSKSTLYKDFGDMSKVDEMDVRIIDDPFDLLEKLLSKSENENYENNVLIERVYLPLYSMRNNEKIVPDRSGLNQRFASGRIRNIYEVYIPIPAEFRKKYSDFFPSRDESFDLYLPNGKIISVKVCQDGGKALMSNPNVELGKWIIDDVLKINKNKPITYKMLEKYGIDSVMLERRLNVKENHRYFSINFAKVGSYDRFMGSYSEDID